MQEYPTPVFIGIAGKAGSGKDTLGAQVINTLSPSTLIKPRCVKHSFAAPLKEMLAAGLGVSVETLEDREYKETPHKYLQRTPRELLQSLGTEWGRDMVDPNIWVTLAGARMLESLENNISVVVTDVRFDNEAMFIRQNGGIVIQVEKDGETADVNVSESEKAHKSEAGVSPRLVDATARAKAGDISGLVTDGFNAISEALECHSSS